MIVEDQGEVFRYPGAVAHFVQGEGVGTDGHQIGLQVGKGDQLDPVIVFPGRSGAVAIDLSHRQADGIINVFGLRPKGIFYKLESPGRVVFVVEQETVRIGQAVPAACGVVAILDRLAKGIGYLSKAIEQVVAVDGRTRPVDHRQPVAGRIVGVSDRSS